jgi:hypothetical protein
MSGWLKNGNMPDDFSAAEPGEAKRCAERGARNLVVGDEQRHHRNSRLERNALAGGEPRAAAPRKSPESQNRK